MISASTLLYENDKERGSTLVPPHIRNNILPFLLLSCIIPGIFYLYWSYVSTIILAGTLSIVLYAPYQRVCRCISEKKLLLSSLP
ncbi:MAG: hypothetical protein JXA44_00540 [Methanospirillaceae archaeon]|nr:hypothetical protein [Methanospirillaceae archaeon]